MERAFGWKGLLIEGDPQLVEQARRVRQAIVSNSLVCVEPQEAIFAQFNVTGLSGIMTEEQIQARLEKGKGTQLKLLNRLKIPCERLETILEANGFDQTRTIDFMSIDVEGLELDIVRSFDWHKWRVNVVLVEVDKPGNAYKMREFFAKTDLYQRAYRIDYHHPDDIYVRKDVQVNSLDSFQVACAEKCRRLTQCKSWEPDKRECESE